MTIRDRVKQLREAHGWTQEELGRRVGVKQGYIALIENGSRQPGTAICVGLADAFGISLDELVRGTPPKRTSLPLTDAAITAA